MKKKLLLVLNLLVIGIAIYGYFLFQSYTKELDLLKASIIRSSQIDAVYSRLSQVDKSLLEKLPLTQLKSGSIVFDTKINSAVVNPNGCEANRGLYQHSVQFERAFSNKPTVAFGITGLDFREGADHRLKIEVTETTETGFTVNLVTWCDTKISYAKADWVAFYSL